MSLDTLLEAAEFLEWRNQSKTRADDSNSMGRISSANGSDTSQDSYSSSKIIYMDPDDAREKRRAGGAGTREVHNKLEKNRRAHLKECFDFLKKQIPTLEDKRTSNLSILRGSIRYIQAVKRKEKEYELEMQRLAREKISLQDRIDSLKSELAKMNIEVDLNQWMMIPEDQDTNSTSTATEQGSPICSDDDDDDVHQKSKTTYYGTNEVVKKLFPNSHQNTINHGREMTVLKVTKPDNTGATILRIPTCKTGLNPRIIPAIHNSSLLKSNVSVRDSTSTTSSSGVDVRTPITQILARTLEKRQLRQQQSAIVTVTSVSPSVKQQSTPLKTIPLRQSLSIPIATQFLASPAAPLTALNKLVSHGTLTMPVTVAMSSLAKGFAQPILVSTNLMAGLTSSQQQQLITNTATQAKVPTTTATVSTTTNSVKVTPAGSTLSSVTAQNITVPAVRPIIGNTAPTHMLGQIPFNIVAAHTLPRTSIGQIVTPVSSSAPSSAVSTSLPQSVTVQQLMSLAQMTQGTQLVSPMSVMSPGVQFAQGLTQTQLSSMLSNPLLKQIPLFQHGFLQGAQVSNVLGQSVVKPVVVVSLPSVVSTSASTTTVTTATTAS